MNKSTTTPAREGSKNTVVKNGVRQETTSADTAAIMAGGSAADDAILYWNAVALEANRVSHTNGLGEQTGPTLSARALAIVHLAMHDAFAGILNDPTQLPPYLLGTPPPEAGASADVAVAAAAYATLSALFPGQKAFFGQEWARADLSGPGFNEGRNFGMAVARLILDDRKNDPDAKDAGYAPSTARGAHRPDPDNPDQGFYAPFYGARSKGFAITQRFGLVNPPRPGTAEYASAFNEVLGKGIAPELMGTLPPGSTPRTPEETVIGLFWAYDGASGLGTPPRLYNQIVREVARIQDNDVIANARLFALVNVAMADAGILAWEQKYFHDLWRPVLGVRENDPSMGPQGQAGNPTSSMSDPFWLPYGAPKTNQVTHNFTPPFPAYPSGHATFGAAALQITRLFYSITGNAPDTLLGNEGIVSDELNGVNKDQHGTVRSRHVRKFPQGLWQMIEENGRSRVYLGVHWVFDAFAVDSTGAMDLTRNVGGVPLGLNIAQDIFNGGRAAGMRKSTV